MANISLRAVRKSYGKEAVVHGVDLEIGNGEFIVILGPSGCGKSTLLRMIAGLEGITSGEIAIADRVVNTLEPRERGCAMVFQNYALYPHMTVAENIGYALKVAGVSRTERMARIKAVALSVSLGDYLDRRPGQLSGGQRQRVAMARAIIREPKVFLFDEPLSNLDAKLRVQMRSDIIQLQARLGTTMVYVTHDQVEAMTMGHRVAVMRKGILQQVAPPQELYLRPANLFVAAFIGSPSMNLITADLTVNGDEVFVDFGGHRLRISPKALDRYPGLRERNGTEVIFGLRPEHFAMEDDIEVGDDQILTVRCQLAEAMGAEVHVHAVIDVPPPMVDGAPTAAEDDPEALVAGTKIIARVDGIHTVAMGQDVRLAVKTHLTHFFDPASGAPLR